ncbi:hypothetical protein ACFW6N_32565 [Streptomyces cyaneofuscatus]|uniref:hypothetical protein n=1 Tax=Streptomyces TaxID=1883 RepID=UPI0036BC97E2
MTHNITTTNAPTALASLYDHFGLPHTDPAVWIGDHLHVAVQDATDERVRGGYEAGLHLFTLGYIEHAAAVLRLLPTR